MISYFVVQSVFKFASMRIFFQQISWMDLRMLRIRSFIQILFHSTEFVSMVVSVSTVSRMCFRKGVMLSDVVSVVMLKIRTERTWLILPDRTIMFEVVGYIYIWSTRNLCGVISGQHENIVEKLFTGSRSKMAKVRQPLIGCFKVVETCSWSRKLLIYCDWLLVNNWKRFS